MVFKNKLNIKLTKTKPDCMNYVKRTINSKYTIGSLNSHFNFNRTNIQIRISNAVFKSGLHKYFMTLTENI